MTTLQEAMQLGRENTIEMLFARSAKCDGLDTIGEKERGQIIETLQRLTDLAINDPARLKGIVLFASEVDNTTDEDPAARVACVVSGSLPMIAASYLHLEPHGQDAFKQVGMQVLIESLGGLGNAADMPAANSQDTPS